jgi:hypothetical protein
MVFIVLNCGKIGNSRVGVGSVNQIFCDFFVKNSLFFENNVVFN